MDFSKVLEILTCPVCKEICLPPIYQCGKGHIICSSCLSKLNDPLLCPTCRTEMPKDRIRALALEHLADTLEIKCRNWDSGCRIKSGFGRMQNHLKEECLYECRNWCKKFGSRCTTSVPLVHFQKHILSSHKSSVVVATDSIHFNISQSVTLQDILKNGNSDTIWEPCYMANPQTNDTFVLHSEFDCRDKLMNWTVINLSFSDQKAEKSAQITLQPDGSRRCKNIWFRECQSHLGFIRRKKSPSFTCSQALDFLKGPNFNSREPFLVWKLYVRIDQMAPIPMAVENFIESHTYRQVSRGFLGLFFRRYLSDE